MSKNKTKINHDIKSKFEHYLKLVIDRKTLLENTIYLSTKKSNVLWQCANVNTTHVTLPDTITFTVETKKANIQDFKFRFISQELSDKPFFRFDSDGATHYNRNENTGIEAIQTPHFQKYNEYGENIVFRTPQLEDKKICEVLKNDINLCMAHFCHEANARYFVDEFPQIDFAFEELDRLFTNNNDPLNGLFQ